MLIWKINEQQPIPIPKTTLVNQKLLEQNLENWIESDPAILGEPLLIIGRQVIIHEVGTNLIC
ncbi:MAG TPA: hypothetical protein VEG44_06295 [Candidatus Acidoferrales bacterium]|nr:hypothetical protein [Candidatus Acidoferrales bacterium]